MAVPGRKAGELSTRKEEESDESAELICQPCSDDGQQLPAAGFCIDCCEHLCAECFRCHCKPRQTRHHVLQDKSIMPRKKSKINHPDTNVDKCSKHTGELVNFYCSSHEQLGCGICFVIDHKKCDNISYIEQEYEHLRNKLASFLQQADTATIMTEQNVKFIESYQSVAIKDIREFRTEINEYFDKLENDAINKVNGVRDADQASMSKVADLCITVKQDVDALIPELETLHKTKQNGKLFTAMDKSKLQMKTIFESLSQIENDNKITRYEFKPEKQIQDLMETLKVLGTISVINKPPDNTANSIVDKNDTKTTKTGKLDVTESTRMEQTNGANNKTTILTKGNENIGSQQSADVPHNNSSSLQVRVTNEQRKKSKIRSATHITDIYVRTQSDIMLFGYFISGSVLLPENRLVIADNNSNNVKLVDAKQNKITAVLNLSNSPWDVTRIDNNQVAVTIPRDNKIALLSVSSNKLSKSREIKVNGQCHGIVSNNDTLIVTFVDPGKVEIIDMSGTVMRSFMNGTRGEPLFSRPMYVAMSPDKTAIYVSDFNNNTVTCMTLTGTVMAVYKDDTLRCPRGIAIDQTGTVYVCDYGSCNIHQITAECTKIQILLQGEVGSPHSLSYCDREDKLYVGMLFSDIIKVFQIK